jgi:hypothetical protein
MADIKLGPSGAQVTLPKLCWVSGSAPDIPYDQDSGADEARMCDGSNRVNFRAYSPGTWTLTWDGLVWADVQTILGAAALNAVLVYTNEYTDNTNHNVHVQRLSWGPKPQTIVSGTTRYVVSLMLREITGA